MLNVVSFKPPKFKPMPSELTPAVISGATLPVKIGIAQRAIAACCDLSELLTWKDKLAALAAAAKMARMPELSRDVNRVHKEAIFRMGEILLTYKSGVGGGRKRERGIAAEAAGISRQTSDCAVRIAKAPKQIREQILRNDEIPAQVRVMVRSTPRVRAGAAGKKAHSDAGSILFNGLTTEELKTRSGNGNGLTLMCGVARALRLDTIPDLTPEEKQHARKIVVEMQEILDDIDRRLGPAS